MTRIKKLAEGTSSLTDQQLILIGRVATGFALTEFIGYGVASTLVTPIQPIGLLAVAGGRFEDLLTKIGNLSRYRVTDADLREALGDWIAKARAAQKDRDRVLHTPWFVEPSLKSLFGTRLGRRSRSLFDTQLLSNRQLEGIANSIDEAVHDGLDLMGRVNRLDAA